MPTVDLNCDLGEGCGNDAELMPLITSANIACGGHAGDAETMRATVQLALQNEVAIGAHPGYPDQENFGRIEHDISHEELFDEIVAQVSALRDICREADTELSHVKPHGALYNLSARDAETARLIANAVAAVDHELVLFGLAGSHSLSEAERAGLRTASEVFGDRSYQPDGSLTPRSRLGALIESPEIAAAQVLEMVMNGQVTSMSGEPVPVRADTICLHGDGAFAPAFAMVIRDALRLAGVEIEAPR